MLYSVELRSHCVIASAKIPYFGKFSNPVSDFFDIFWLLKLNGSDSAGLERHDIVAAFPVFVGIG